MDKELLQMKKSSLNNIIYLNDLDKEQLSFFRKYEKDDNFIKIIQEKPYNKIADTIDYFRLVEAERNNMPKFFEKVLSGRENAQKQAQEIKSSFVCQNEWSDRLFPPDKGDLTKPEDIKTIAELCRTLAEDAVCADEIFVMFFENLVCARKAIESNFVENKKSVEDYLEQLPDNWYSEPWYYTYVQYFGTNRNGKGDFASLKKQLDYLEEIGIKNIYILPHYQSPNGDAGYDISDYKPSKDFGGEKKFKDFMKEATKRGFRVATDLVFNHTATEHKWFLSALRGESKYYDYYLKCPPQWDNLDINEILKDEYGDLFLYLEEKDEKGVPVVSKRILIFPDVDKTLWLKKEVKNLNREVLFYREFYPFQVDLDLQNPKVINELFKFLGEEISLGILGKRTDAIAHWIKKPGTNAKDLPATYALQQLIKQFLKHVSSKTIILPEVVTTSLQLKKYAGEKTVINGTETTTGGDALLDFQLQGMLREMMYFGKTTPFWTQVHKRGKDGDNTAVTLLPIEHHDETYMGFIQEIEQMRDYIQDTYVNPEGQSVKRGIVYKNGMSGGARYANCLDEDSRRIAAAFFCQYMMPAVPVIYYGTEIGATNRPEQMQMRQKEQFNTLKKLLGDEVVGQGKPITFEKCEDPRELQRGSLEADLFKQALKDKYPAAEVIKSLNKLRLERSALSSRYLSDIATWDERILGLIKYPYREKETPLIAFANLSGEELTAKIPIAQIKDRVGKSDYSFNKILQVSGDMPHTACVDSEVTDFPVIQGEFILISLKPYECLLLEVV